LDRSCLIIRKHESGEASLIADAICHKLGHCDPLAADWRSINEKSYGFKSGDRFSHSRMLDWTGYQMSAAVFEIGET
jgi:hypothetical protein